MDFLKLQTGDYLLLQTGDKILLAGGTPAAPFLGAAYIAEGRRRQRLRKFGQLEAILISFLTTQD